MEAAWTWIGSSHKMKRGRKLSRHSPTGNGDEPVLQRLTECVEIASRKLGKLIQKQDPPMCQRGFPRNCDARSTADQGGA
jgi:hypothetical protein